MAQLAGMQFLTELEVYKFATAAAIAEEMMVKQLESITVIRN